MEAGTTFTGGCLCGSVRFEAHGTPENSLLCHCRMCQRASGAPVTGLVFMTAENITVTKGQTRAVPFSPRTWRHICEACASPVFFTRAGRPNRRAIYVGALDDPGWFRPAMHVCVSSAMPWLDIRDDVPRYNEKPPQMSATLAYDPASGKALVPDA